MEPPPCISIVKVKDISMKKAASKIRKFISSNTIEDGYYSVSLDHYEVGGGSLFGPSAANGNAGKQGKVGEEILSKLAVMIEAMDEESRLVVSASVGPESRGLVPHEPKEPSVDISIKSSRKRRSDEGKSAAEEDTKKRKRTKKKSTEE